MNSATGKHHRSMRSKINSPGSPIRSRRCATRGRLTWLATITWLATAYVSCPRRVTCRFTSVSLSSHAARRRWSPVTQCITRVRSRIPMASGLRLQSWPGPRLKVGSGRAVRRHWHAGCWDSLRGPG